jgi:hypothetical protein
MTIAQIALVGSLDESSDLEESWRLIRPLYRKRGRRLDLRGAVFGRLTVVEYSGVDTDGGALWKCSCLCGEHKVVSRNALVKGRVKSCGCLMREYQRSSKRKA